MNILNTFCPIDIGGESFLTWQADVTGGGQVDDLVETEAVLSNRDALLVLKLVGPGRAYQATPSMAKHTGHHQREQLRHPHALYT